MRLLIFVAFLVSNSFARNSVAARKVTKSFKMNSLAVTGRHLLRKFAQASPTRRVFIQNMSRCSSKGPSKYVVKDRRCEPIEMSFNSYETPSPGTSANPVIIMHGNVSLNPPQPSDFPIPPLLRAGLFGSKQNWRSISKALHAKTRPTRKIVSVDARNHGESPHSPNHRYEDLVEDIHEFFKQNGIEKAVVIGHSMGGRAMMAFALKYVKALPSNELNGR